MANLVLKNNTSGGKTSVTADEFIGNASSATKAGLLSYQPIVKTDTDIDAFLSANALKAAIWTDTSSPGTGNGILLSGGYTSTNYGFQLAIDDDPSWMIKLRQRNTDGWKEWKRIPMGDGTGASGTWGISITGNAATATTATSASSASYATSAGSASSAAYLSPVRTLSGDSHALALKNEFTNNKASIQRNKLITYYSGAYGNGSQYMGYFLPGYDTTPYGGFFVAHYDSCYYVGISYGTFNQQQILTSSNYSSWAAPASHSHSYVPLSGGTMTGKLQVNNTIFGYQYGNSNNKAAFMWDKPGTNYTGVGACGTTDMIHFGPCDANANWVSSYNQIWRFQGGVYATGWLETDNCGTSAPGSSTPGYGRGGALYFKY